MGVTSGKQTTHLSLNIVCHSLNNDNPPIHIASQGTLHFYVFTSRTFKGGTNENQNKTTTKIYQFTLYVES